jgi:hypothetical protein
LSPIEQSRELNPLDAALDSETQKQAVEVCFDCALGDIQVASDFRVVASLEQQIDDLPFPRSHLAELLFHKSLHLTDARGCRKWRWNQPPRRIWIRVFAVSFCIHAAKCPPQVLTKYENSTESFYRGKNVVTAVIAGICGHRSTTVLLRF